MPAITPKTLALFLKDHDAKLKAEIYAEVDKRITNKLKGQRNVRSPKAEALKETHGTKK